MFYKKDLLALSASLLPQKLCLPAFFARSLCPPSLPPALAAPVPPLARSVSCPSDRRPSALPSRIALAAARPTTFLHYRTLIRSAVPVASRVSSPLLQRREASHRPCVRSLRYRVLGACGVCGDTNDLEARTHSRVRPHTGPQCVFLPASRPPPASRTSVLRPSSSRALSFVPTAAAAALQPWPSVHPRLLSSPLVLVSSLTVGFLTRRFLARLAEKK